MSSYISYIIGGEHFVMSADRALFWENEKTLIVADLHVGKTGHFRKEGIGVPPQVYKDDLHRLLTQIFFFKAEKLIIVGDLTHSIANSDMNLFRKWRKDFPLLDVHLVKGNHDILSDQWYNDSEVTVDTGFLRIRNFCFVHDISDPQLKPAADEYIFSGHLHPGISIKGRGRQSLHFPCFYFTKNYCVLPAFSRFTGTYKVIPERGEKAYVIIEKSLVPV